MKQIWEATYTCAAHSDRKVRFSACNFEDAYGKAHRMLAEHHTEHGKHGGYTHSVKYLQFITDYEESYL